MGSNSEEKNAGQNHAELIVGSTRWGVVFDELVIAESLEAKGELCGTHGVNLFFDDQDECIATVPECVLVCKVRNGGNFDFARQQWISTGRLTRLLR